ncbi:MAG: hypothetical protein OEU26_22975 [Candidatus Tectomicrobia bacterium]|nr:hypothetical protein [Candidatus Tectomicrobia bacterium]
MVKISERTIFSTFEGHSLPPSQRELYPSIVEVAWAYYGSHREDIDRVLQEIEDI